MVLTRPANRSKEKSGRNAYYPVINIKNNRYLLTKTTEDKVRGKGYKLGDYENKMCLEFWGLIASDDLLDFFAASHTTIKQINCYCIEKALE